MGEDAGRASADENAAIRQRLRADREWLSSRGIEITQQYGPDDAGNIIIYLAHYSESAEKVLKERYGSALVVNTVSRRWRFT